MLVLSVFGSIAMHFGKLSGQLNGRENMKIINIILTAIFIVVSPEVFGKTTPDVSAKSEPQNIKSLGTDASLKSDASGSYSGYYVFDGKMYFYDQESGTFSAANSASQPDTKAKAAQPSSNVQENDDLLEKLRNEDYSAKARSVKQPKLASTGQIDGSNELNCAAWGSPMLDKKTYQGKEECDNELETALDKALMTFDKYVDSFEKEKRALMISSNLDEYNKLSPIRLNFQMSRDLISQGYKKGCVCVK